MHDESPVNAIPPAVVALFLVIVGVELVLSAGARGLAGGAAGVGWRVGALQDYAFSGPFLQFMLESGRWSFDGLKRFVTYPFVHAAFMQTLFSAIMLLALGKMVAEALGSARFLVIFFVSSIFGALVFGLLVDTRFPLSGAFPGVYGLIGAFTYLLWLRLGRMGEQQLRAFQLIGVLLGIQLVFGLFFGSGPDWIADVAGFLGGFAVTIGLMPGGVARLRDRLRDR